MSNTPLVTYRNTRLEDRFDRAAKKMVKISVHLFECSIDPQLYPAPEELEDGYKKMIEEGYSIINSVGMINLYAVSDGMQNEVWGEWLNKQYDEKGCTPKWALDHILSYSDDFYGRGYVVIAIDDSETATLFKLTFGGK
ncbi:hypothetical protein [Sphingobium sp. KCTC 72723]|uniref:hypothetical protein n=1 Tax=Sphingobium sp. KCTC 72723 TaxID=2733867 RepID=UPI00165D6383|nr:hypothetical protein [Sphingobium sp. KCTC 72723]